MAEREPMSLRMITAVETRLRPLVGPRILRRIYQLGAPVLRLWWLLTRPHVTGVRVVVHSGDDVLLVRHTYGGRGGEWDLPGGFMTAGESGETTLRRELAEELGLAPASARVISRVPSRAEGKRELRITYAAEAGAAAINPNPAEIAEARWFPRDALPERTTPLARQMIARAYWPLELLGDVDGSHGDPGRGL